MKIGGLTSDWWPKSANGKTNGWSIVERERLIPFCYFINCRERQVLIEQGWISDADFCCSSCSNLNPTSHHGCYPTSINMWNYVEKIFNCLCGAEMWCSIIWNYVWATSRDWYPPFQSSFKVDWFTSYASTSVTIPPDPPTLRFTSFVLDSLDSN